MAVTLSRRAKQIARELGIDAQTINGSVLLSAKDSQRLLLKELETTLKQVSRGSKTNSLVGYVAKVEIRQEPADRNGLVSYSVFGYVAPSKEHESLGLNVFDVLDQGRPAIRVNPRDGYTPKTNYVAPTYAERSVSIRSYSRADRNGVKQPVGAYTAVRRVRTNARIKNKDARSANGKRGYMPMFNLGRRLNVQGRNTIVNRGNSANAILRYEPRTQMNYLRVGVTLVPSFNKQDRSRRVSVSIPTRTTTPQATRTESGKRIIFTDRVAAQAALGLYLRTYRRYEDKLAQSVFSVDASVTATTRRPLFLEERGKRRGKAISPEDIEKATKSFYSQARPFLSPAALNDSSTRSRLNAEFERKLAREVTRLFNRNRGNVSNKDLTISIDIVDYGVF